MPKQERSVYENVIEKILFEIKQGNYCVNQRLPSERCLSERLEVSRGSLREALRVLEQQQVVEIRSDGRYLIHTSLQDKEVKSLYLEMEQAKLVDLIEARLLLEDKIVELACERATSEDLKVVKDCLRRTLSNSSQSSALNYDNLFHAAIANAAHNSVFANVYSANLELLQKIRIRALRTPGRKKEIKTEHENIYLAIADRDSMRARLAARIHLRNISKSYFDASSS